RRGRRARRRGHRTGRRTPMRTHRRGTGRPARPFARGSGPPIHGRGDGARRGNRAGTGLRRLRTARHALMRVRHGHRFGGRASGLTGPTAVRVRRGPRLRFRARGRGGGSGTGRRGGLGPLRRGGAGLEGDDERVERGVHRELVVSAELDVELGVPDLVGGDRGTVDRSWAERLLDSADQCVDLLRVITEPYRQDARKAMHALPLGRLVPARTLSRYGTALPSPRERRPALPATAPLSPAPARPSAPSAAPGLPDLPVPA